MASNTFIGWTNYFKTGAVTAGSSATGLSPSNLQLDACSPSTGWQTVSGVTTGSVTATVLTGAALRVSTPANAVLPFQAACLVNTNLRSSASVAFSVYNGSTLQGSTLTVAGPSVGYGQVVGLFPSVLNGDHLMIAINDSGNPDGFINVGGAYAGPMWNPLSGVTWSTAYGGMPTQVRVISRGGQEFRNLLYRQRYWKLNFDNIHDSEAWTQAGELDRIGALGVNVLFIPNSTSAFLNQETIFGPMDPSGTTSSTSAGSSAQTDVTFPHLSTDARGWSFQITERL